MHFEIWADFATQVVICEVTFLTIAFVNAFFYAGMASRARVAFGNRPVIGVLNKVGGSLLIGAGVATVAVKAA